MRIYSGFRNRLWKYRNWIGGLFFAGIGISLGIFAALVYDLPDISPLEDYTDPKWELPTKLYDAQGAMFAEFFQEKREIVQLKDLPDPLIKAFLASEDRRFYEHRGVDFIGILRAMVKNVRSGRVVEGGSTITQQLAKVLFLTREREISRKIREALLAVRIERRFSKPEILERYLNTIYLGEGAYGVEAAARIYFQKHATDLLLGEAAMIAALPKAPVNFNPYRHPQAARLRQEYVLKAMAREAFISDTEVDPAIEDFWQRFSSYQLTIQERRGQMRAVRAPFFAEVIRQYLAKRYGFDAVYKGGLEVRTTLDLRMQEQAEQILQNHLAHWDEVKAKERAARGREPRPPLQGALVAIDVKTGDVKALVGGNEWSVLNQYNRATQSLRQPGSAFKPFVYIAALENGLTQSDKVLDAPAIYQHTRPGEYWTPANYDNEYYGEVTLRMALMKSMNVATVKLMEKIGARRVIDVARRFGFTSKLEPFWALALGSYEVNLLELTAAYAAMANGGIRHETLTENAMVRQVIDREGALLEEGVPIESEAASPTIAYLITNMLTAAVQEGTGYHVGKHFGRPAAGKTGTTNDFKDAWFIGYTPEIACGVWVGYDDHALSIGARMSGGVVVAPIWTEFMQAALVTAAPRDFPVPPDVQFFSVCTQTGELATEFCPKPRSAAFQVGTEPTLFCTQHRSAQ
ncbi:PBP1A family penicillin-binding protein [bacterium]|nr:PBP1A family penicillin-binding protein [bacterium]